MTQHSSRRPRGRVIGNLAVFVLGIALAIGFYAAVGEYVPVDSLLVRYCCAHPIEYVEVWMFFWGLSALLGKWLQLAWQRAPLHRTALPAWDGKPVAVAEAGKLLAGLNVLPRRLGNSVLGRRLRGGLDFVASRGSTDGLDDYLRSQSDAAADALDGSHALLRFITWAIPILGFLGTVLGITEAIANVTPEQLAKSITGVTDGLAIAFDTTALALGFSMALMFFGFVLERGENGLLQTVDQIAEQQLAHRFERMGSEKNEFVLALKQNTHVLLSSTEKLVERQAELWSKSLAEMRSRVEKAEKEQHDRFTTGLRGVIEQTVEAHQQRLEAMERKAADRAAALQETMAQTVEAHQQRLSSMEAKAAAQTGEIARHFEKLGQSVHGLTGALQQETRRLGDEVVALKQVMEAEVRLADLQETLNHNLQALVHAGTLQQAMHSLTAAIHLLTANAEFGARGPESLRLRTPDPRPQTPTPRQGNAA